MANDKCWEWPGQKMDNGCGLIYGKTSKHTLAHRAIWELVNGQIPRNAQVLHHCDNPPCINPDHLFLGDPAANARDMCYKKRDKNGKKSHCLNGHPFDDNNTHITTDGRRQCRICTRIRWNNWYLRKQADR